MGIIEKIESLRVLEEEYNTRRAAVTEAIVEAIRGIGQNPAIRPLGKHLFTIRFSDLSGTPWDPAFHDWERQASLLMDLLFKKPIMRREEFICKWAGQPSKAGCRAVVVEKHQFDRWFLVVVKARL